MKIEPPKILLPVALLLNRLSLGLYFLAAAAFKVNGEIKNGLGSFYESDGFKALQPSYLSDFLAAPFGYLLPWAELVVGVMFVIGAFTRINALLLALMLLSFTMALIGAKGPSGGLPNVPFHPNIILLTLAVLIIATGPGRFSVDAMRGVKAAKK